MNIRVILFFSACFSGIYLSGMELSSDNKHLATINASYHYRQATPSDLSELLELINNHAIHDHKKIVILPKKFRQGSLQSSIEKKRIFVAQDKDKIVGYKKLFVINDEIEKGDILTHEIRCINNEKNCTFAGFINQDNTFINDSAQLLCSGNSICIYNGGDFTLPEYRAKGINSTLTNVALFSCMPDIKTQIQQQKANAITMLYGITKANAGEQPGRPSDRSVGIIKQFKSFIQALENKQNPVILQHHRYNAFMPTFDPESLVLKPLPDEQSISGFGCVLTYQLKESHE